jgi:hypothetical protein
MAMHGIYLDIRNKKMVLYCSLASSIVFSFTSFYLVVTSSYLIFLFSIYLSDEHIKELFSITGEELSLIIDKEGNSSPYINFGSFQTYCSRLFPKKQNKDNKVVVDEENLDNDNNEDEEGDEEEEEEEEEVIVVPVKSKSKSKNTSSSV